METAANSTASVNAKKLFLGSCVSLIATSVAFATVGAVMGHLKTEFGLTNQDIGWIGGAALWGFAVSQLIFSPLADTLGMRALLRMAFVGHLIGTLIMIFATGFATLFLGALVIAMANGLVEAACNPLVATLFPDNKTVKLNQFHVWFPGGIVLGGLASYLLDQVGITSWQVKLALILIPTIAYGVIMLSERFPATEGVQKGVSMGEMFKASLTRPLMLLMLLAMAMTASIELGPNRWLPAVLESGGMPGILVLVWVTGLMAVMRYFAGPLVHRLSPTGILLASSVISAVGLLWLSYAESLGVALAAATIFAVGVCYFWPTMLGFVSERIPRSGALGLGLMGAMGMAVVGIITSPRMGTIADRYAHEQLPVFETVELFEEVQTNLADEAETNPDADAAVTAANNVLEMYRKDGRMPENVTANALRATINSGVDDPVVAHASAILQPADNYGGRVSFRRLVPLCGILFLIFGFLYVQDRKAGGYKVVAIDE
ncbi:MAG: MFS transporter [Rhodothermales bacterium]